MGGSFNPVHAGHLMLADYLVQFGGLDEVWLMLSPLNPLKADQDAPTDDSHRMEMLRIATRHTPHVGVTDIELSLPRPSYSCTSLRALRERYPECRFSLVIGSDNWLCFDRWRNHREIIAEFTPVIYPRPGYPVDPATLPDGVSIVDAPVFEISSTFIRSAIAEGHDMTNFLPPGVYEYICAESLYKR